MRYGALYSQRSVDCAPSEAYTRKLIRTAVRGAEREGCDVHEQLLELTCQHSAQQSALAPDEEWFYRGYSLFLTDTHSPEIEQPQHATAHRADGRGKAEALRHLRRRVETALPAATRSHAGSDGEGAEPDVLLRIRVRGNVLYGGTGCAVWDAGAHLSHIILSNPWLVTNKHCLELGNNTRTDIASSDTGTGADMVRVHCLSAYRCWGRSSGDVSCNGR